MLCASSIAQNVTAKYEWGGVIGPDLGTPGVTLKINDMEVDVSGNIYTTGTFKGTVDFDQSSGTYNLTSIGGTQDIFFAKYNSSGVIQWAKKLGGSENKDEGGLGIALDANSNVYLTGYYYSSTPIDFDPGAGIYNLPASPIMGYKADFIAKYSAIGDIIWAKGLEAGYYYIEDIKVDQNENVFIVGQSGGGAAGIDLDPGPGTGDVVLNGNNLLMFFAEYDNLGNHVFSKAVNITGTGYLYHQVQGTSRLNLGLDSTGNIILFGSGFNVSLDFDPSASDYILSIGLNGTFLAQYNSSGLLNWASLTQGKFSHDLKVGQGDQILIGGQGTGGTESGFFSKYDKDGNNSLTKVYSYAGFESQAVTGIAINNSQEIYVTGYYYGNGGAQVDLDPNSAVFNLPFVSGYYSTFISKFSSVGNLIWAKPISSGNISPPHRLALNGTNVFLTMPIYQASNYWLRQTIDLDLGPQKDTADYDFGQAIIKLNEVSIVAPPTAQPTNLVFTNVQETTATVSWTAATGSPAGYVVVRREGTGASAAGGFYPQDGYVYSVADTIGFGRVVHVGNGLTFNDSGLLTNSGYWLNGYYYDVFAYNGSGITTNYREMAPLTKQLITLDVEPTEQPTTLTFSSITTNEFKFSFNTNPSYYGNVIVIKAGSPPTSNPVDGLNYNSYSTIAYLSSMEALGDGLIIDVGGNNSNINFAGLSPNTTYYLKIYAYGASQGGKNYLLINPLSGSHATMPTEPGTPPSIAFSNITTTSLTVSYTAPSPAPTGGYLVIRKFGAYLPGSSWPLDGIVYNQGDQMPGGEYVVYKGTNLTFNDSGMPPSSRPYYYVFGYNGSGILTNYGSPLIGLRYLLATEPTDQPTTLSFNSIASTSFTVSYSSSTTATGYVVISGAGTVPTIPPTDGTIYSAGYTFGDGSKVKYVGANNTFNETGLTANQLYYYKVYAYSGTNGEDYNYLTSSPLSGSQATLPTEPTNSPLGPILFSNITTTSLNIEFTASAGGASGYVAIRRAGASPTGTPTDAIAYMEEVSDIGDGRVAYIGSSTNFNDTGLSPNTVYYYDIFAYNGSGAVVNYKSTSPLEGSRTTLATEPTTQPTALVFSSITSSSFTVSYVAGSTATGYMVISGAGTAPSLPPTDGAIYSVGQTLADGSIVKYVGANNTFNETGLTANQIYYYKIYSYGGTNSESYNYLTSIAPLSGSQSTLPTEPTNSPVGPIIFSNITPSSLNVEFTASPGGASGYMAIRRAGASPTGTPVDATSYTEEVSDIGDGRVAYIGSSLNFNDTGLSPNTVYHYDIYAYNGSGAAVNFKSTAPLEGSRTTFASDPTASPTAMSFASVTTTSFQVNYVAATGTPTGYLVLRKIGGSPTSPPIDGSTYSLGNQIGDGEVVYIGGGTTFPQTSLTEGTAYHYDIFAYNGSGIATNYRETSPLEGSQITPITAPVNQPTGLSFSGITPNSISGAFLVAAGTPTGYLVVSKAGSNPSPALSNNVDYTVGQILSDGSKVVLKGSTLSFTENSLSSSTLYYYDIYSYNQIGSLISYRTTLPLEGNATTYTGEPTAQPTGIVFSNITATTLKLSFNAPSPAPSSYLVIRKAASAPTFIPLDGTDYAIGSNQGDAVVAYKGSAVTFDDSNLLPGTIYHYVVFSFNGSGASTNYLSVVNASNSASKITVPDKPVGNAASLVTQTSFQANWSAVTGATGYRVDVSSDNFVSFVTGYNDLVVNQLFVNVNGLLVGSAFKYRVRGVNASGVSQSSDPIQQLTTPQTPAALGATNISQTGFTANWNSISGVSGYFVDVSSDEFLTFAAGYDNKSVVGSTLLNVTSLTPGLIYKYRIRSANSGGSSPSSDPPVSVLLVPGTPVGAAPTLLQATSFKANWLPVVGADEYRIDVSLSSANFTPSLPDHTNISITGNTEYIVDKGLSPTTTYKFRVRAVNLSGTSPNSPSVSVVTTEAGGVNALTLSNPVYTEGFTGTESDATLKVLTGTAPFEIKVHYRPILSKDFIVVNAQDVSSLNYKFTFTQLMLDELGVEFFFSAIDGNNKSQQTDTKFIYKSVPTGGIKIPFVSFGGTLQSYEIFSIPYKLTDDLVGQIFEELGPLDKSKWRLVRYQGGKNVDLGTANRIDPGKGYWFNRKDKIDIQFSGGTVVKNNQSEPFKMQLEPGWNQIGNPYPFDIDWDDILDANPAIDLIGNLKVYNAKSLHLNDESNNLKQWSGGFVHNGNSQTIELMLPVALKSTAGGRKSSHQISSSQLDQPEWFVPISISQGEVYNNMTGFGMHPQASGSIDRFDDFIVPRFLNYLELFSNHSEFFTPKFSKDVVPTAESFTWTFNFESNLGEEDVVIKWNPEGLGNNEAKLLLLDASHGILIDMKNRNEYRFKPKEGHYFKVFYGINNQVISPDVNMVGHAYPNPFNNETTVPFVVKTDQSKVSISLMDITGRKVVQIINSVFDSGVHSAKLDLSNNQSEIIPPGVYLCRVEINGYVVIERLIKY